MPFPSFSTLVFQATFAALTTSNCIPVMKNTTAIVDWIQQALQQYPEPQILLNNTVEKLDDYALAYLHQFHVDQANRAVLNAITLEHQPELESPLFNAKFIQDDFEYHEGMVESLQSEIERRII
jgi:hypothetical protein